MRGPGGSTDRGNNLFLGKNGLYLTHRPVLWWGRLCQNSRWRSRSAFQLRLRRKILTGSLSLRYLVGFFASFSSQSESSLVEDMKNPTVR